MNYLLTAATGACAFYALVRKLVKISLFRSLRKVPRMLRAEVTVLRYISNDPPPGIVEFQLEDANGHRWLFLDKTAIVSGPRADTTYPQPGIVAGETVPHGRGTAKCEVIRISTERPCFVQSVDGSTEFDVATETLVVQLTINR